MIVTCPHCAKKYRIDPDRLPANTSGIKCKACGTRIDLPGRKPRASSPPSGDILRLFCPGCGKQYRLPKAKIPPGRKTVTCRECGETILLRAPRRAPDTIPVSPSEEEQPDLSTQLLSTFTPKRIFVGAGALVLLVLLISIVPPMFSKMVSVGGRVSRNLTQSLSETISGLKDKTGDNTQSQAPSTDPARRRLDGTEPILALRVQGSVVMNTLKGLTRAESLYTTLESLQPQKVCLWLCPDAEQTILPVIAIDSARPQVLVSWLGENGQWAPFVKMRGPGQYQIDKTAILASLPPDPHHRWDALPWDRYAINVVDHQIMIVPDTISSILQDRPYYLSECHIASFSEPLVREDDLFCCAVEVTHGLPEDWRQTLRENAFVKNCPGLSTTRLSDNIDALISRTNGCLDKIEQLAVAYRVTGDIRRKVTYTQRFRSNTKDATFCQQIKQGRIKVNDQDTGLRRLATTVCSDPLIKRAADFQENQLTVDVNWTPVTDKEILPLIKDVLGLQATSSTGLQTVVRMDSNSVVSDPGGRGITVAERFLDSLFYYRIVPERNSRIFDITRALLTIKGIRNQNQRRYGEDIASLYFAQQRGRLFELIPLELAMADATKVSQNFFRYTATPYRGYFFKPLTTRLYTVQTLNEWRRTEGERFPWTGDRSKYLTIKSVPNLIAIPIKESDPIFVYCYDKDKIFLNHSPGSDLSHLPEDLSPDNGWVEIDTQGILPDSASEDDSENATRDKEAENAAEGPRRRSTREMRPSCENFWT